MTAPPDDVKVIYRSNPPPPPAPTMPRIRTARERRARKAEMEKGT